MKTNKLNNDIIIIAIVAIVAIFGLIIIFLAGKQSLISMPASGAAIGQNVGGLAISNNDVSTSGGATISAGGGTPSDGCMRDCLELGHNYHYCLSFCIWENENYPQEN